MERQELRLLTAGALVGIAMGFLVARTLYEKGPEPAGPMVMGPAAPGAGAGEGARPMGGGPPMGGGAPTAPQDDALHAEITALLDRARADPKDREARVRLGNITFDHGLYDMAARFYQEALSLDASDPAVLVDLGLAYHNLAEPRRAAEALERAVGVDPTHAKGWYNLAVVRYQDLGDAPGAREAIAKALLIEPGFPRAGELLARLEGAGGG